MAKLSTVKGDVLIRVAGETVVVGVLDIPVTVDVPDGGRAVVRFPKATVRAGLKKLAKRIGDMLA
ncbi:hypothetical protein LLS1_18650 [Leifsonia sp. LS1]|uniref:hypothetical protein n=1 Tax=Leifsonia sp. LS1 TaxID=2828483 RepID=UPI001CFD643D|nr:hypothetical protein [Leifsonia sp. LS1]GIT80196.1 hypothetical protein LLS1_18650 [Leifsonia sp. LS1]